MPDTPIPVPDPTIITTQIIDKEIRHVHDLVMSRINEDKSLCDEKFNGVDAQLKLIERQRIEQKADATATRLETKADTTKALEAALVAAKDQVAAQAESFSREFVKSESSTARQIEQQGLTFTTQITAIQSTMSDLKDSVNEIKNVKVGNTEAKSALYALVGFMVSLLVIGGFVAAVWP